MRSPTRSERSGDSGQATVELALALPLLMLLLLAWVQLAVVIRDQLAVISAAREGARAAAVSTDQAGDGSAAARQTVSLQGMQVSVSSDGVSVTVVVTHRTHTDIPLVGLLLPDIDEVATATMRIEP